MKYIIILITAAGLFFSEKNHAQSTGDIRGSLAIVYGTDVEAGGINIGVEYLFSEKISAAPSFSTFIVDPGSFFSINLDGRYYFNNDGKPQIYGLFGIAIEKAKIDLERFGSTITASDSKAGLNFGVGMMIPFSEKIGGNLQLKVATPGNVQITPQAGLAITF